MTRDIHLEDTIAAIATPPGDGGIAIVRISGPDSLRIADVVFRGHGRKPSQYASHVILHGRIVSSETDLDEVLLLIMRGPHSYTGEDVVEIQGHGGLIPARRILRRVLETGARAAEPGEFTQRAFLNGRMDLLQAEAVLDLVRSRTDRAAAAALEQLEGGLSRKFNTIYDELITFAADLEATLDFPEDELPSATIPEIASKLASTRSQIDEILHTWEEGHLLREGALCVITGKTNVGKSTLLNAVLGRHRAIVSPLHGTTRDSIEEAVVLGGILLRMVDTAGLRESDCGVEKEGIRRTRELMEKADIRIHMIDASAPVDDIELRHLASLNPEQSVVVLNKTDMGDVVEKSAVSKFKVVRASLLKGQGLEEIKTALLNCLAGGADLHAPPHAVISERHRRILDEASKELNDAFDLLSGSRDDKATLAVQHLRTATESIGRITGRVYEDELLNAVFSRFCIGK
jgi:tRNA modification GTPase